VYEGCTAGITKASPKEAKVSVGAESLLVLVQVITLEVEGSAMEARLAWAQRVDLELPGEGEEVCE
jgi:hypothetical protein